MDREVIIDRLARKHNLSKKEVREAVDSQSACVAHVMRLGKADSIRLPYWGKFDVHPYRKKKVEENSGKSLRKT